MMIAVMAVQAAVATANAPMPPVGGIAMPAGTSLANMRLGEGTQQYRLRSALSIERFIAAYADAASAAGYRITLRGGRRLVIMRDDGTLIDLRMAGADGYSIGELVVRSPAPTR